MKVSLSNPLRHPLPRVPFSKMKDAVLGADYELSLAFVTAQKMRTLNHAHRQKNVSTDILSFPLSKTSGEIFLCMTDVAKKATLFSMTTRQYLGYVFIHGLLHLEGLDHGRTMSLLERKFCRALGFPFPS